MKGMLSRHCQIIIKMFDLLAWRVFGAVVRNSVISTSGTPTQQFLRGRQMQLLRELMKIIISKFGITPRHGYRSKEKIISNRTEGHERNNNTGVEIASGSQEEMVLNIPVSLSISESITARFKIMEPPYLLRSTNPGPNNVFKSTSVTKALI
ncbi:unnamed protein product [Mucor hiemalis]